MKYIVDVGDQRHEVELDGDRARLGATELAVSLHDVAGTPVRLVRVGDAVHRVVARRHPARGGYTLWIDGWRYEVEALDERTRTIRDLTAASGAAAGPAPLVAPMPGLVVRVLVEPGDEVRPGQGLVVMEAMKMENELRAASGGRVARVLATPGTAVEKGALLVELS